VSEKLADTICPNCEKKFVHDENFVWELDEKGHPTIEFLACPFCGISTKPAFECRYCPVESSCDQEEECKCCGAFVKYDAFLEWQSQEVAGENV
jgi:hypothetical protein